MITTIEELDKAIASLTEIEAKAALRAVWTGAYATDKYGAIKIRTSPNEVSCDEYQVSPSDILFFVAEALSAVGLKAPSGD